MFHVMLVLPLFIALIAVVSIILFSIVAIIAACIGGTTVAVFIKNAVVKKMLLLGFGVLLLIGLLCLTPFIAAYASLPAMFFVIASNVIYLCIVVLAIVGIKLSCSINNKVGKIILIVVFSIVLAVVILVAFVTGIASFFLQM